MTGVSVCVSALARVNLPLKPHTRKTAGHSFGKEKSLTVRLAFLYGAPTVDKLLITDKMKLNSFLADTLESLGFAPGLWRDSLPSLFTREDNEEPSSV